MPKWFYSICTRRPEQKRIFMWEPRTDIEKWQIDKMAFLNLEFIWDVLSCVNLKRNFKAQKKFHYQVTSAIEKKSPTIMQMEVSHWHIKTSRESANWRKLISSTFFYRSFYAFSLECESIKFLAKWGLCFLRFEESSHVLAKMTESATYGQSFELLQKYLRRKGKLSVKFKDAFTY